MKKFLYILITFSLLAFITWAQAAGISVAHRIILTDDDGNRFENAMFGVDTNATDGIDPSLGEFEIPNFPPGSLHALFKVPDKSGLVYSYKDIRPNGPTNTFYVEYLLDCQVGSGYLHFQWAALPAEIDSAYLTDNMTGDFWKVNMIDTNKATPPNIFLHEFYIKVWYNKRISSVSEPVNGTSSALNIYPNPASDQVNISALGNSYNWSLFNLMGYEVLKGENAPGNAGIISLSGLPAGFYEIRAKLPDGRMLTGKIMKTE